MQTEELRAGTELSAAVDGVHVASPGLRVESLAVGLSVAAGVFVVARCLGHKQSRSLKHTVPLGSVCEEVDEGAILLHAVATAGVVVVSSAAVVAII